MGWLTPKEQLSVRREYKVQAFYMCDWCHLPISIREVPVIDPKKGYHSYKSRGVSKDWKMLTAREPRCTYHLGECNDRRLGRRLEKYSKGEDEMPKKAKASKSKKHSSKEKVEKKSRKSKKEVSATGDVKSAAKAVLKLVGKKPNHYSKTRVMQKLKEDFDRATVRDAITYLWQKKQIRKKDGGYFPVAA